MNLKFVTSKEVILFSLLFTKRREAEKLAIPLKNRLWDKYRFAYSHFLDGDYRAFIPNVNAMMEELKTQTLEMLKDGSSSPEIEELYNSTVEYKNWVETQFREKNELITNQLESILKVKLPQNPITVYIVDPAIGGGSYLENNQIFWGHKENWGNYNMVYLAHEYLHTFIDKGDIEHAVIELATDNELRIRLNGGGEYFMENNEPVGHSYLLEIEKKLYDSWKVYLDDPAKNIFDYIKEVRDQFNI